MRSFLVPDEPGVYLIHDIRGALYVGRSADLRRRFSEHCDARGNELIARAQRSAFGVLAFSWTTVLDGQQRAQVEHMLITWLQPPCNRVIPRPAA
jgi:excinuclease UvrABC nuclease subunit